MNPQTIHDFDGKLVKTRARILRAEICDENKQLMLRFEQYLALEGLSAGRRWKLLEYVYTFSIKFFPHPFKAATADEIWQAILAIESHGYAPWTKHDFKVAIRKLYKFVEWGTDALQHKEYPERVAGISTKIKKRDRVRIQAADILTEEEVERVLRATTDVQEHALVSLMYELGARVGEIGPMLVGSISRDQYSYVCDLNGKTGPRSVRVVRSAAALTAWMNHHPAGSNPRAPLWGTMVSGNWQRVRYEAIKRLVKDLAATAGIAKKVHPHLFRHSRITHVLASGKLNEAQAKVFFGLSQDSDTLATYSHLISRDANDAILKMHGIEKTEAARKPAAVVCGSCHASNPPDARFCQTCSYALSADVADDANARIDEAGERVTRFLQDPANADAFRLMIRREVENALGRTLLERSAQPGRPNQVRRRRAEFVQIDEVVDE